MTGTSPLLSDAAALPRGRHALTPLQVSVAQRQRLLRAVVHEVAERGYARATAARVHQRAGVSSRAFYAHFPDLQTCFLAAYDESVAVTANALSPVSPGDPAPLTRLTCMIDTYLSLLDAEPALARVFLVEVYAAGNDAVHRRLSVHEHFVDRLCTTLTDKAGQPAPERTAVAALVDAITFRATRRVLQQGLPGATRDLAADRAQARDDLLDVARRLCPWLVA